jgi:O-antigen ligase
LIDAIIIARKPEPVMNPIEHVLVKRSSHVKLALAVAALVLVLWLSGSAIQSLWIAPAGILVLWMVIQMGLRYRHRHST